MRAGSKNKKQPAPGLVDVYRHRDMRTKAGTSSMRVSKARV
ncbi:hypothetical protein [Endozoicomonas sp.]|nr:hypothetical protein [Endozoicomonas sp.]